MATKPKALFKVGDRFAAFTDTAPAPYPTEIKVVHVADPATHPQPYLIVYTSRQGVESSFWMTEKWLLNKYRRVE